MDIINFIEKLLKKGICLKVLFKENDKDAFQMLLNSDWINKLKLYDKQFKSNKIISIYLDEYFSFKDKIPYAIEYINLPDNFSIENLDNLNLDSDESYFFKLKNTIIEQKLLFNNYLSSYYVDDFFIEKNGANSDQIILCTYPNHKAFLDDFEKFKNKIIDKFFTLNENKNEENLLDENIDYNLINTFEHLGISFKNKDVKDPIFIDALKNIWNLIIKHHKKQMYEKIKSEVCLYSFSEEEKNEFLEELSLFKSEMDKDDMDILKQFNSIKEIISYWPSILYPIPPFVYNEY
jgi:hypothetical protein